MSTQRHVLLGMFFIVTVGFLSYFTLFKTDFQLFGERHVMTVYFSAASGLREGNSVLVAGMRWGQVERLEYEPTEELERRIVVQLSLESPVTLYNDHYIRIEDATVLGGKQLVIEPGMHTTGVFPADRELRGMTAPNVLSVLADVVDENREPLNNIMAAIERMVEETEKGDGILGKLMFDDELSNSISDAIESVATTFENAAALTTELREGEGTLNKLLYQGGLYDTAENIVETVDEIVANARAGNGVVGMLLNDEVVKQEVSDLVTSIKNISGGLERGEGTFGRLLTDDTLARDLEGLVQSLTEGEGSLARLIEDPTLYDNLLEISEDLKGFTAALRTGEGTIGKLVYDDELYVELKRTIDIMRGSLEEAREAAPISTFLNTVFIGF